MDQKELDQVEREFLEVAEKMVYWKTRGFVLADEDIQNALEARITHSEGNLIDLTGSPLNTPGHIQLKLTKAHNGVDKFNIGVDTSPVKLIASQEGRTYRSAMVLSDADSPTKTSFGIGTSKS